MNEKKRYVTDEPTPEFLYEVSVNGRTLRKGQRVSVGRGVPRIIAGEYAFLYGERTRQGVLLMFCDGPYNGRSRLRRVTLREEHIKTVHRKCQ